MIRMDMHVTFSYFLVVTALCRLFSIKILKRVKSRLFFTKTLFNHIMSQPKPCEKKGKGAEIRVQKILAKIESLKLSNAYISRLNLPKTEGRTKKLLRSSKLYSVVTVLVLFVGIVTQWFLKDFSAKNCVFELPSASKSLFRPPEDCSMCVSVEGAVRLADTSAQEFEERYAYNAAPVIVTDATDQWKAIQEFSFNFFANFYRDGKMGNRINDCFFFAYKSGLNSLQEVFSMDEARANLSGDPWYVGWSTCYSEETRKLRSYYNRPYFLPKTAESDMVDWIFMGGPGQGAHMHVDSVKHMSWQAQVRGRKRWELAPPPECLYVCRWLSFTLQPGDILVVDTNRWYHKTTVLPGDISITIGAEYD